MKARTLQIFLLFTILVNGINFYFSDVEAHSIKTSDNEDLVIIENEIFSTEFMKTGETLTVTGTLVSLADEDLRGWISIFAVSTEKDGSRWEMLVRDPPEVVFDIKSKSSANFSLSAKALEPGTYHIHSQFNIADVGPVLGPGETLTVTGEVIEDPIPFTPIAYQLTPIVIGSIIITGVIYYIWKKRR